MKEVKVYTTATCPWCRVAKKYLDERGETYQEVNVGLDQGAAEEMVRVSGQYGVPVITVDGQVVIGFDQAKLDRLLASA